MLKINPIQSLSLDFIRFFAVQAVLIGHSISFFNISKNTPYIQNMGVVLFFVLSGLIISYTVFYKSQGGYSFRIFFLERFARIYTGLIPSLLFILLIDFVMKYSNSSHYIYENAYNIKTFIGNIFMLQDYQYIGHYFISLIPEQFHITSFGSGRPLWTLAIEWWLYMCFGLLYFVYRKSFSWKYFPLLLLVSIVPLWNLIHGRGHGLTIYWIFGIIITLFVFKKQYFSKSLSLFFTLLFLLCSIIVLLYEEKAYSVKFVFFIAGFMFFMLLYQQNIDKKFYNIKRIIQFGAGYSFTLYLIHYSIIEFIISLDMQYNKYILAMSSVVIANVIAAFVASKTEMKYKVVANILKERVNHVK